MSTEESARDLHDRASQGVELSAAEQSRLDAWYAEQDHAEAESLGLTRPPQRLDALQRQVETALGQILTVAQHIQDLVSQNQALRHEIAALQRRLSQTLSARSA